MTTSGTVGQTNLPVNQIVEHALRRVRIPPAAQTPEMTELARRNLYLLLVNLANRGLNLWCVQSDLIGLQDGTSVYPMPTGSIGVLNVVYCQPTRVTGTDALTATSITTDLGAATLVRRVGAQLSTVSASDTLVLESSDDNVTWTTLKSVTKTDWATGQWYWYELDTLTTARYFRLSATNTLTTSEFYLATQVADLPVVQWNRDTWAVINNKAQRGRPSTNYYIERLLTPRLTLWPVPNNDYDHLQVFHQRQVQDIGPLTNDIEIPQRWVEGVIWQLAVRLAYEIPQVDLNVIPLVVGMADKTLLEVEREETDGAPMMLQPNVSVYSR